MRRPTGDTDMANSWRISALAERHRALGSKLEDWSGMGTAWTYAQRPGRRARGDPHSRRPDGRIRAEEGALRRPACRKPLGIRHQPRHFQGLPGQERLRHHAQRSRQVRRRLRDLPHRSQCLHGGARLRQRPRDAGALGPGPAGGGAVRRRPARPVAARPAGGGAAT